MFYRRNLLLAPCLVVGCSLQAQIAKQAIDLQKIRPLNRVTSPIDENSRVVSRGNVHPMAKPEYDLGIAELDLGMDRMILVLQPDTIQQTALEQFLAAQRDPGSPQYRQWVSPEDFGNSFGISPHDLDQVVGWLESHGFDVEPVSAGRRSIVFSGTASQVAGAFHTSIHKYNVNGVLHHANSSDPEIPLALAPVVNGLLSLNDFQAVSMHTPPAPAYTTGSSHYVAPSDFAAIYDLNPLYNNSINGSGQSIAVAGRCNIKTTDIQSFRSQFGLHANTPNVIVNGRNPGIISTDEQFEATLDVEWSGAVAENAAINFVVSASTGTTDGVTLSSQYIVNHNLSPVMTLSFGNCEAALGNSGNQFWNSLWQQAASEGMSVMVAAGDSGAAGCDSSSSNTARDGLGVNGLCSPQYSTCVGGTQFNDVSNPAAYWSSSNSSSLGSALSYIPEVVWNQSGTVSGGSELWAGGGGSSSVYSKPAWQSAPGVPADKKRDVPDVSLNASTYDGYLVLMNGSLYDVGGTSAATPSFAGLMGLVVQKTGARQGNINPNLYSLATKQSTGGAMVFHDITSGNNSVPGQTGFSAGPGYDLASGLGSVDGALLVNNWSGSSAPTPNFQLTLGTSALNVQVGAQASTSVQTTVSGGFSSSIGLSTSTTPSGLTAQFQPNSFSAPGSGNGSLTFTAASTTSPGTYNLTITGSGGGVTQNVPLAVTIQPNCSYSLGSSSANPSAAGGSFSVGVTTSTGCTWTASTTTSWISITSGTPGNGSGTVNYSVQQNASTSPRSGSMTIAGQTFGVTQAGATVTAVTLSPTTEHFGFSGGRGSFTVTSGGSWTAVSNNNWITITSGGSSAGGNTTVNFQVTTNGGFSSRTGTITVGNATFTVTQAGF